MTEREKITIRIEVPAKELREINEAVIKGDPIAKYMFEDTLRKIEGELKKIGYVKSGDAYRVELAESDEVFPDSPIREFEISTPIDADGISYHTYVVPSDRNN